MGSYFRQLNYYKLMTMQLNNNSIDEFLNKNKLTASNIDEQKFINTFINHMDLGLNKESSSLAMLNSYIDIDTPIITNKNIIVLDAGGTNLRVCLVNFDEKKQANIEYFATHSMPGLSEHLSQSDFYARLCEYLQPVIHLSDTIGFCFSYPTEINEEKDGRLLYWTKEINVPEMVGQWIGQGLLNALHHQGHSNKRICLLNDTVATLLAGRPQGESVDCQQFIGFILGTGTNAAFVANDGQSNKIFNLESGDFDELILGDIDRQLDLSTSNPGCYLFEKMISGCYLGELVTIALKQATIDSVIEDIWPFTTLPAAMLTTALVSLLLASPENFNNEYFQNNIDSTTLVNINHIAQSIVDRAAKLTALSLSAIMLASQKHNQDKGQSICINLDGSTYFKLHGFSDSCKKYMEQLNQSHGINYHLISTDNAPIIGAAIAAM